MKNKINLKITFSESDDTPNAEILVDLRQAWHEAMTGQTIPVSQLWDDIDDK
ncbi:MAG: hypothetical protein AAF728_17020 [Cyanobacteria bacterium P01_D01_bin.128]